MKRISIVCLALLCLLTIACQPTPEEEYVVNKGGDPLRTVIDQNGSGFSIDDYRKGLPERWKEMIESGNGAVTVTANGPIVFPAAERVPIWEIVPGGIDLKAVEILVQLLVPGGYLSKIPVDEFGMAVMTKERIQAEMEANLWRIEHARELLPDVGEKELEAYRKDLEAANLELMKQYGEASSEEPVPLKDLEKLREDGFQGDLGLFDGEDHRIGEMMLVFDSEGRQREQVHYRALDGGARKAFVFSREESIQWAQSLVVKLGYGDRYALERTFESSDTITMTFNTKVNGIGYQSGCGQETEYVWTEFAPEECFEVTLDKSTGAVCVLSWVGRSELRREVTCQTTLLPAEKVQALVRNDLGFLYTWTNENIRSRQVNIRELRFGYKRIKTPNEQNWLLVPAWAVIGTVTDSGFSADVDTNETRAFHNKTAEGVLMILNAADGTLIGTAAVE